MPLPSTATSSLSITSCLIRNRAQSASGSSSLSNTFWISHSCARCMVYYPVPFSMGQAGGVCPEDETSRGRAVSSAYHETAFGRTWAPHIEESQHSLGGLVLDCTTRTVSVDRNVGDEYHHCLIRIRARWPAHTQRQRVRDFPSVTFMSLL